jgi:hypothetical protein
MSLEALVTFVRPCNKLHSLLDSFIPVKDLQNIIIDYLEWLPISCHTWNAHTHVICEGCRDMSASHFYGLVLSSFGPAIHTYLCRVCVADVYVAMSIWPFHTDAYCNCMACDEVATRETSILFLRDGHFSISRNLKNRIYLCDDHIQDLIDFYNSNGQGFQLPILKCNL